MLWFGDFLIVLTLAGASVATLLIALEPVLRETSAALREMAARAGSWLLALASEEEREARRAAARLREMEREAEAVRQRRLSPHDTIDTLERLSLVLRGMATLRLPRRADGRLDPRLGRAAQRAVEGYYRAMLLATAPSADPAERAARQVAIFDARVALAQSLPLPLTPDGISALDAALGLPPVDPLLGVIAMREPWDAAARAARSP